MADIKQRGSLDETEFIIAMHLLSSYRTGIMKGIPQSLPPGLYEAAARRGGVRISTGSRVSSGVPPVPTIPKQFSGSGTQSPLSRQSPFPSALSPQGTGMGAGDWLVTSQDKTQFDTIFSSIDRANTGYIAGDLAVDFFSRARLPEDTLAQIWDLADINMDGQLNRDEFSVAMYLVRQQLSRVGPLPETLPPNLVPPSMRRRVVPAPAPVSAVPPVAPLTQQFTASRSASDDLLGLDVFSAPSQPIPPSAASPQVPQSTGGSNAPFQTPSSPVSGGPLGSSSSFKPFVPSSSFGQSLAPQLTGQAPQPAADDLLGDADPEESNKLTQDTTDLANLSNQVGNLSKEMQSVQQRHVSADRDLAQTNRQKREFEARLSEARVVFEKESQEFRALEERLTASRAETEKLRQEYATIETNLQDLLTQSSQASAAFEADQRENLSLKEKIRQANLQVAQLNSQLEKLKSDAKQQRSLASITQKQLATVEGQRDQLQGEVNNTSKEFEEPRKDEPQPIAPVEVPPPVTSPATSTASQKTNPFFKRTTSSSEDATVPPVSASSDTQSMFDNVFGAFLPSSTAAPMPATSFRSSTPGVASDRKTPTPVSSVPPRIPSDPPAPPQSRQVSGSQSGFENYEASAKPSPPPSRVSGDQNAKVKAVENKVAEGEPSNSKSASPDPVQGLASHDIPGAFPSETISPQPSTKKDVSFDDVFGGLAHQRSQSQKASDFEEAFASMNQKNDSANPFSSADGSLPSTVTKPAEFPPITEFEDDSDSENEEPGGFGDSFTPASPPHDSAPKEPSNLTQNLAEPMTSTNSKVTPDFEAAFSGINLAPAKEDDDEEDDFESQFNKDASNFDISFDTSQQLAKASAPPQPLNGSSDFSNFTTSLTGAPHVEQLASASSGKKPTHDWDALFSALEPAPSPPPASAIAANRQPGWALSADSGEDDAILKRLTGMGYPRDESLAALEKYDYDLNQVCSSLSSPNHGLIF